MPLILVKQVLQAKFEYGYFGLSVYGPLRCGKSSFAIQTLAELYGITENPDWEKMLNSDWDTWKNWVKDKTTPKWDAWKDWLVFKPSEYVNKISEENDIQRPMLVWDDAAFWLSHYGYKNPFLKSIGEYLNVAATDWACILFTCPSPKWLLTHVRNLPGGHTGRVSKFTGDPWASRMRYMKVYQGWTSPDLKKYGVTALFKEDFSVILPNKVFYEYDKVRREYVKIAKYRLRDTLKHVEKAWGKETAEKRQAELESALGEGIF